MFGKQGSDSRAEFGFEDHVTHVS